MFDRCFRKLVVLIAFVCNFLIASTVSANASPIEKAWISKDGEVYTRSQEVCIPPFKLIDAPFFAQRQLRNTLYKVSKPWKTPEGKIVKLSVPQEMLTKHHLTGIDPVEGAALRPRAGREWYSVQRLGGSLKSSGGMNFYTWKNRFSKSHPEYFALQFDGTRNQRTAHVRICKSNPEVIKQAAADAIALIRKNKRKYYICAPTDGDYDIFCMCPNCRAWDPSYEPAGATRVYLGRNRPMYRYVGSTDRVFRFTCEIAKELKKTHPKVKVGYLAYAGYLAPPRYYRDFPDNLTITFVGLQYLNKQAMERDRAYWKFWARVSDELILRPNHLLGGGGFPLMYMHEMAKDLRYCAETGMVGSDYDSLVHHWATNGLNYYVLAEMLWDPSLDVDELIDEYCRLGFGKGAEAMKKYFLHCEKLTSVFASGNAVTLEVVEDLTVEKRESMLSRVSKIFNEKEMATLGGYIDEARKLTAAGSIERRRVEFIAAGYDFTKNRIDFAKKFAAAKSREEKRKLSEEQRLYWWKIYNDHPFAVSIPGLFRSQYLSFWRHAGWKAPELK